MGKERSTFFTDSRSLELMYTGLRVMEEGFEMVIKTVTAPFVLEAKLLDALDRYLSIRREK